MSVVLYAEEKFLRIYQSLKLMENDVACVFGYPKGWDQPGGMDEVIRSFITDLRRANIITWNRQYPRDPRPLTVLDLAGGMLPYGSDFELLKSLKGLHYNLISNDGKESNLLGCCEKLYDLIFCIMSRIIERLPVYQNVDTW